jgi:hypothetical protein
LLNENHENSKHQKPNIKQIPMTQIQNSKQRIGIHLCKNGIFTGETSFAKRYGLTAVSALVIGY